MNKHIIAFIVGLSTTIVSASYVTVINKKNGHNGHDFNIESAWGEWQNIDAEYCDEGTPLTSASYYGIEFEQNVVCHQKQQRQTESGNIETRIFDTNKKVVVIGTHLENNCNSIFNNNYANTDGVYTIDNDGSNLDVYCKMDINNSAWTMVTRLNTKDSVTRRNDNSIWTTRTGTGTLTDNFDYMSPYSDNSNSVSAILLEFNYNGNQMLVEYKNDGNVKNYFDLINQSPSNNNIDFTKTYTNNSTSNTFFGSILSFQVIGKNGDDQFRLWYNRVPKATCNQTGGIGTKGDAYSWWIEAGFTSTLEDCQENFYRSYLGSNHGGSHDVIVKSSTENILTDPTSDIYNTDLIRVYVK